MQFIEAVWNQGVFTPLGDVDIAEGAVVKLRIAEPSREGGSITDPSPFLEDETMLPPVELPLGPGTPVKAKWIPAPLPDPHDIDE